MKTIERYITENGRTRKVKCILPFCERKFPPKPAWYVCKFNVTPAKYSPIYYCGSIGEALVDFHTLKHYRYKEAVEIISMESYDRLSEGKPFTINEFANWLLSKVDTGNGRILANLIDHNYHSTSAPKYTEMFSREEAEKIVKEELYFWMDILPLPNEYAHYQTAYHNMKMFDDKDFYYVMACLYAFSGQKYPFLNEICHLIEEDYETIELVDLDTFFDTLTAIMQESNITVNDNAFDSIRFPTD